MRREQRARSEHGLDSACAQPRRHAHAPRGRAGAQVEVFCYAVSPSDGSEWRQRIEAEAEHFLDVSAWPVGDVAGRISADRIHVAINLNGYTKARAAAAAATAGRAWRGADSGQHARHETDFVQRAWLETSSGQRAACQGGLRAAGCFWPDVLARNDASRMFVPHMPRVLHLLCTLRKACAAGAVFQGTTVLCDGRERATRSLRSTLRRCRPATWASRPPRVRAAPAASGACGLQALSDVLHGEAARVSVPFRLGIRFVLLRHCGQARTVSQVPSLKSAGAVSSPMSCVCVEVMCETACGGGPGQARPSCRTSSRTGWWRRRPAASATARTSRSCPTATSSTTTSARTWCGVSPGGRQEPMAACVLLVLARKPAPSALRPTLSPAVCLSF